MKAGLMDAYRHKPIEGGRCGFCSGTDGPFCLHVAEFSQSSDAVVIDGFVPMSQSRGRLRGSIPICIKCAPACTKCTLPIVTRWTVGMIEELKRTHGKLSISVGNGWCRHIHLSSWFISLFKGVRISQPKSSPIPAEIENAIANLVEKYGLP